MDRKTLAALKKSIKHWEENVKKAKKGILRNNDIDGINCALCELFSDKSCDDCPVKIKSGERQCRYTPYSQVVGSLLMDYKTKVIEACKKELTFLKSLLPVTPKTSKSK